MRVIWLGIWFDPARERDAAMALFNQHVDVIAFHTGSNAVMTAAQERGRMAVAYHLDMRAVAPDAQIIAVTHEYGAYYTQRAKAVLDGTWKGGDLWGGVKEDVVRVGDIGPRVPPAVQQVLPRQAEIASGRLQPFFPRQAVRDNEGRVAIAAGQSLSGEARILAMNWLVEGVQGRLAKP